MVFSASSILSLDTKGNSFGIVGRQLIFLCLAIPCAFIASRQSLSRWRLVSRYGFIGSLILMLLLLIPGVGKTVNGNRNWIHLGIIDIQPSEIAKFLLILWASSTLAKSQLSGRSKSNALALLSPVFGVIILLIMLGRDLGTSVVFVCIFAGLLWVSGVSLGIFAFFTTAFAGALTFFILTANYRAARFLVVLNPFSPENYKNAGWQPAHSILGLASGGFFGVGLGASRQKWGNLAEAHTDFIFSVIGEELGLFGTLGVLGLFAALIFSIFSIALRTGDAMSRYACVAVGCWLSAQVILNIGSATSLLPVVGVTLPLISYGGSSLISVYLALGFVLGVARREPAVMSHLSQKKKK